MLPQMWTKDDPYICVTVPARIDDSRYVNQDMVTRVEEVGKDLHHGRSRCNGVVDCLWNRRASDLQEGREHSLARPIREATTEADEVGLRVRVGTAMGDQEDCSLHESNLSALGRSA